MKKYIMIILTLVSFNVHAEENNDSKKNKLGMIVSVGNTGLERKGNTIRQEKGPVLGISYERKLDTGAFVGLQVHTNGQTGFTIGSTF